MSNNAITNKTARTLFSLICYAVSILTVIITICVHFSRGGSFGNIFEYCTGYLVFAFIVAMIGTIFFILSKPQGGETFLILWNNKNLLLILSVIFAIVFAFIFSRNLTSYIVSTIVCVGIGFFVSWLIGGKHMGKAIFISMIISVLLTLLMSSSIGSKEEFDPYMCHWCDGYGFYVIEKGGDAKMCSHCHGTGKRQ